jgi:hypothetical protein
MQDAVRKELRRRLAELVTEIEKHDSFRRLASRVPRGESPEAAGDESGFGHAQQESTSDKRTVAVLPGLEGADNTEEEKL